MSGKIPEYCCDMEKLSVHLYLSRMVSLSIQDYKNTEHPFVIWTDLEWSYCVCPACPDELSFSCQSECHQTIYRGSLVCQLVQSHQGAGELPKPKNNTATIRAPQIGLIQIFFWITNIDRQDQIRVPALRGKPCSLQETCNLIMCNSCATFFI